MALIVSCSEIISDAFLFAGIGDQYNAPDGVSTQLALRFLNGLTDSWSSEEMTIYDIVEGTFNMPNNGTNTSVIGPGQNLNQRPAYVEQIAIVDSNGIRHRCDVIGVDEWARIPYPAAPGRPEVYYNDNNSPTETWSWWPTPAFAGDICHAFYWNVLPQFAAMTDLLSAPPAYPWFLKTNLGLALMASRNKTPTPLQKEMANNAKRNARRGNNQPKLLETDLPMQYVRTFNIYTGQ